MTRTSTAAADWSGLGRMALCLALGMSGTALITTGRALLFCGAQLHALRAQLDPQ